VTNRTPIELQPKPTPARIRRKRRRRIILIGVGALLLGSIGWVGHTLAISCGGWGSGVQTVDGECIGVTDGGYIFNPKFADVERKIAKENASVSASGHAVTIALLEPFTVTSTSALDVNEMRSELEGAYTAQWRANHTKAVGDTRPMIRMMLANEGSAEAQWQTVTQQLEGMVNDSAPLVAVAGLGVSFSQTVSGALDLSEHGLPTVGAVITADTIDYSHIHGFVRVEPSDRQYVASLQHYLTKHPELKSALVVYDNNSDNGTDLYTQSLRNDLETMIVPTMRHFDSLSFTGISVPSQANPDMFANITTSICAVAPNLVLYSGRQVDLKDFLKSLQSRICSGQSLTVATAGTDLGALDNPATVAQLKASNLSVVYASSTDAAGWEANVPGTPPHFAGFYNAFKSLGFNPADLDDGDAIATHDSVFTAAKAVRLAYASESGSDPALPKPQDVLNQLLNLNNKAEVVPAAAGDLSFSYSGANTGNPEGEPIPVLKFPAGTLSQDTGPVYTTH
jgi:ABC-type branched-subunit amino acid transport system substrate-binding protein